MIALLDIVQALLFLSDSALALANRTSVILHHNTTKQYNYMSAQTKQCSCASPIFARFNLFQISYFFLLLQNKCLTVGHFVLIITTKYGTTFAELQSSLSTFFELRNLYQHFDNWFEMNFGLV